MIIKDVETTQTDVFAVFDFSSVIPISYSIRLGIVEFLRRFIMFLFISFSPYNEQSNTKFERIKYVFNLTIRQYRFIFIHNI